jgi:hypothetical protein
MGKKTAKWYKVKETAGCGSNAVGSFLLFYQLVAQACQLFQV